MSLIGQAAEISGDSPHFLQLRRGVWFGADPTPLARVLYSAGRIVEYDAGQSLSIEGSPAEGLFGLLDGAVHFESIDRSGRRVLVHVGGPGYWFGEAALNSGVPLPISARAFRRVRALQIPSFILAPLLRDMPEFHRALASLVSLRLTAILRILSAMRRPTAMAQIAARLAELDRIRKESDKAALATIIHMTQGDLADMTGHSRQTVNAIVSRFHDHGLVKVGRRQIEIVDGDRLTNLSEMNALGFFE